ncbi:MAG: sigma-70 family RNA polymerase sigma factor [Ruminococcus sp.]|nr:sigma-70 family RNA polymerase sigma factor [Ruminococcus sp.]
MDDERIIELYFKREESAIDESRTKYGDYINTIAYRILYNREDAAECENDTYLSAWSTMPPNIPNSLKGYLGMLCRSCSLDRWRKNNASKRGAGETQVSLSELEECVPDNKSVEDELEEKELAEIISYFLRKLPEAECSIFLYRYWYLASIKEICKKFGMSESKIKTTLYRTRIKLKEYLFREGIFV